MTALNSSTTGTTDVLSITDDKVAIAIMSFGHIPKDVKNTRGNSGGARLMLVFDKTDGLQELYEKLLFKPAEVAPPSFQAQWQAQDAWGGYLTQWRQMLFNG